MKNPVLYVILNGELRMSPGKAAAQAVHAVMKLGLVHFIEKYRRTVIVLEAKDTKQILNLYEYLKIAGRYAQYYIDEGKNEVDAYSVTAMAVCPVDEKDEKTREIFSALPLYDYTREQKDSFNEWANAPINTVTCESTQPDRPDCQNDKIAKLEAENKELRRLWIENEGDIIELKCMFNRYLRLNKRDRLKIGPDDPKLLTDRKQNETEEYTIRGHNR